MRIRGLSCLEDLGILMYFGFEDFSVLSIWRFSCFENLGREKRGESNGEREEIEKRERELRKRGEKEKSKERREKREEKIEDREREEREKSGKRGILVFGGFRDFGVLRIWGFWCYENLGILMF